MTTLILHPHTISDLTLTSVRRNDVLKYAQSFLHFFKIWKMYANNMKNWQKIRNSTEIKTNKQTNKKQQQKRPEKKIYHRIHKDKGNTMIYKKNMPNL